MRISKIELEYSDIEWFAVDINHKIMRFTSGLYGYVPEFVCASKENTELLCKFFDGLPDSTEGALLQGEIFGMKLLDECKMISQKGIYCFDAFNGQDDTTSYTKISAPTDPLYFCELPEHIRDMMRFHFIDVDADAANMITVDNAY